MEGGEEATGDGGWSKDREKKRPEAGDWSTGASDLRK
jgi:hypothetical protein